MRTALYGLCFTGCQLCILHGVSYLHFFTGTLQWGHASHADAWNGVPTSLTRRVDSSGILLQRPWGRTLLSSSQMWNVWRLCVSATFSFAYWQIECVSGSSDSSPRMSIILLTSHISSFSFFLSPILGIQCFYCWNCHIICDLGNVRRRVSLLWTF